MRDGKRGMNKFQAGISARISLSRYELSARALSLPIYVFLLEARAITYSVACREKLFMERLRD